MGRRAKPGEPPANRRALDRKLSGSALEEPQFKGGQTCEANDAHREQQESGLDRQTVVQR